MRYDNVAIPAGFAWSSPFTRWQGSLAEVSSLDLAADVAARALAERRVDPARMAGLVAGFVRRSATTSHLRLFILARCRLPGQRSDLPGDLCSPTVSRSGPGSPLFKRLGCLAFQPFRRDSRVLAGQCVRSSFLFRLAAIFMSARPPGGCPGPEVPGARVEGRLSSTAICCHISMPRPRRVLLPRSAVTRMAWTLCDGAAQALVTGAVVGRDRGLLRR